MSNWVSFSYAFLLFVAFVVTGQTFFFSPGEPIPFQTCHHAVQEECFVYTWENLKLDDWKYFTHVSFVGGDGCLVNTDFIGVLDPRPTKINLAVLYF